jgi:hypothetical protein
VLIILIILIIPIILQVRIDLGIADHVWQDKRTAIAQSVDELSDQFKPAMRAGWMKYIRQTYPAGAVAPMVAVGEGTLVLDDDE